MNRPIARNIMLHYPKDLTNKPIISNLIRQFDIVVNISRARIDPDEEGTMVIELSGIRKNVDAGISYLKDLGISLKSVSKIIKRIDERCTHCGTCVTICPTGALTVEDRKKMLVSFIEDKCIACGLCVNACPYKAMKMVE